jgi:hypothetical protein
MKIVFRLFVLALLVGGWALAAAALHLLVAPGSVPWLGDVIVMPKDHLGYRETFADVRKWTATDLATHPAIANRLQSLRKTDVLDRIERNTNPSPITSPPTTQPTETTTARR